MRLVALGPPGAGKGTQTKRIAKHFNIAHISTGDLLRDHIKMGTPLGISVRETMERGDLVSDDIIIQMVTSLLDDFGTLGFIFDGFPRNRYQAEILDAHLEKIGSKIDKVINIDVPDEVLIDRIAGRLICPKCGAAFHVKYLMPKVQGICDNCGERLIQRKDDEEKSVVNRLNVYHETTRPMIKFYESKGILETVDGTGEIEEVSARVFSLLEGI